MTRRGARKITVGAAAFGLVSAGLAIAGARPAAAFHQATLHVEARAWFPTLDAEARVSDGGLIGTTVTNDDIGVDDPDVVPGGSATLRLGRHILQVEGFGLDVEGDRHISRTIDFDGRRYQVGTRVTSEASVAFFGLDYGYDLAHNDVVGLGFTLGGRVVSTEARLTAPDLGIEGRGDFDAVLPAVGARIVVHPFPVPLLSSMALVGRVVGGYLGDHGRFLDFEAGIEWLPIPALALRIGYRHFSARGEDDDDEAKVDLSGPFASLTLAF